MSRMTWRDVPFGSSSLVVEVLATEQAVAVRPWSMSARSPFQTNLCVSRPNHEAIVREGRLCRPDKPNEHAAAPAGGLPSSRRQCAITTYLDRDVFDEKRSVSD